MYGLYGFGHLKGYSSEVTYLVHFITPNEIWDHGIPSIQERYPLLPKTLLDIAPHIGF